MSEDRLDGQLYRVPFQGGSLIPEIATRYEELADEYGSRNILVLKRLPTGVSDLTDSLSAELDYIGVPNVQSVAHHARNVISSETDLDVLRYEERIEVLAMVLDNHQWENNYFEGPSELDSFGRDVGRILMDATWLGGFDIEGDGEHDTYLSELAEINQLFHERLRERGLIEQAMVVTTALETLAEETVVDRLQREFDAIIVVEFEEFNSLERSYLARISSGVTLECLAEADSSIERVWNEVGDLDALASGLSPRNEPVETGGLERSDQAKVAQFLATGDESLVADVDTASTIRLIRENAFEEQLQTVANEIEYLRSENEWEYGDFAVLLKDSSSPISEVRHALQHAGLPVASVTVAGLDQDRAVRELHALAEYARSKSDEAQTLLETRIDVSREELESIVEAVESESRIERKLRRWIDSTNLKHRIAANEPEIAARNQFAHVKKLLEIAEFIDTSDFMEVSWSRFISMLERTITDYAPSTHSMELDVEEGGVMVDTVNVLKNEERKAVFLIDVVEGTYPADLSLTPLFPRNWLTRMTGYPNITAPTLNEVRETFSPPVPANATPVLEYYRQLDRRKLAIGARAAEERLYFCSYLSESEGGRSRHQSRYLSQIRDHVDIPQVGDSGYERDIYTTGRASKRVLDQPWERLEAVRAAASTGQETIELKDTEELFGAIQELLKDTTVNERFVDAAHRQIEMARGEVGDR